MNRTSGGGSLGGQRDLVIVGREREQDLLREALDSMLAGKGSLVLISGEAGIGKTTLVEWLAREAEARDCVVLRGGSYDLTVTPPYGPWVEAARTYQLDDQGLSLPAYFTDPAALERAGSQQRLFEQAAQFLNQLTERHPTILILEDVHWADAGSIEFLRFLARQLRQHRLLMLATYRSDELQRQHPLYVRVPAMVRESGAGRIELRPLDKAGQRALIRSRYDLTIADQKRLESYLEAQAEGNPLVAGELLRTLEEDGTLTASDGRWLVGDLSEVPVPSLLRQVIDGRLARFNEDCQRLLEEAAVIGQTVPLNIWGTVAGVDEDRLFDVADRAGEAHILATSAAWDGVRFYHALVREALYKRIPALRRRRLHQRVAEALIASSNPDPDEVAHHFEQAGDDQAVEWLIKAGERAQRAYSWLTAAERFETAANLMANDSAAVQARIVLLNRAAMWRRYADPALALTMLEEVLRLAVSADDHALMAYVQFDVGMLQCFVGDLRDGLLAMKSGIAALDALAPLDRARLDELTDVTDQRGTLAHWLARAGHFEEALMQGTRVLDESSAPTSSETGGGSTYADAGIGVSYALAAMGRPDEADDAFARAIQIYRIVEHHAMVCWQSADALRLLVLPYRPDDLPERRRLARQTEEAARLASEALVDVPTRIELLSLLAVEGNWAEAIELAAALRSLSPVNRVGPGVPLALGPLAREQGDTDLAWSLVHEQIPDGATTTPGTMLYFETLDAMRQAATLALDAHDLESARNWLEAHDHWLDVVRCRPGTR